MPDMSVRPIEASTLRTSDFDRENAPITFKIESEYSHNYKMEIQFQI